MREICKDANLISPDFEQAMTKVFDACEICAKNGQPKSSRQVSLTHVNEAFNVELQIDFFYFVIQGVEYIFMNLTDSGTGYSELSVPPDRTMATIIRTIEKV